MKQDKTTIKQALDLFGISRTTLYKYLKILNIKPKKEGKCSHLTNKQITDIKRHIGGTCSDKIESDEQSEQTEHVNTAEKLYQKQITELKKELETKQEKIEKLTREVGRWEGVANTLKDQNQKLLEVKTEPESEIVEAEIINSEPPEEKAEKRGFFQKLFNFKK